MLVQEQDGPAPQQTWAQCEINHNTQWLSTTAVNPVRSINRNNILQRPQLRRPRWTTQNSLKEPQNTNTTSTVAKGRGMAKGQARIRRKHSISMHHLNFSDPCMLSK